MTRIRACQVPSVIFSLIITIIILLILVGVSINLAIKGDLFGSTQKAVSGTNAKVEEEQKGSKTLYSSRRKGNKSFCK